jgi:predicted adenine nucleotide alpha hydrolase (AANH) superfamily ATPase
MPKPVRNVKKIMVEHKHLGSNFISTGISNGSSEKILLHICCAPCATTVIKRLQAAGYDVHGFFYNPNIQPEEEYYKRLLEAQRISKLWNIPLEIGEYDWDRWQAEIRGLEKEKEGRKRCLLCYRYRLTAVAQKAKELGIGVIATTLTISPRKQADIINPIGEAVCEDLELRFYEADWKKQDGFKHSLETCKALDIYRQNYCGCKYSIRQITTKPSETKPKPEVEPAAEAVQKPRSEIPKWLRKKKTKPWRQSKN